MDEDEYHLAVAKLFEGDYGEDELGLGAWGRALVSWGYAMCWRIADASAMSEGLSDAERATAIKIRDAIGNQRDEVEGVAPYSDDRTLPGQIPEVT